MPWYFIKWMFSSTYNTLCCFLNDVANCCLPNDFTAGLMKSKWKHLTIAWIEPLLKSNTDHKVIKKKKNDIFVFSLGIWLKGGRVEKHGPTSYIVMYQPPHIMKNYYIGLQLSMDMNVWISASLWISRELGTALTRLYYFAISYLSCIKLC